MQFVSEIIYNYVKGFKIKQNQDKTVSYFNYTLLQSMLSTDLHIRKGFIIWISGRPYNVDYTNKCFVFLSQRCFGLFPSNLDHQTDLLFI